MMLQYIIAMVYCDIFAMIVVILIAGVIVIMVVLSIYNGSDASEMNNDIPPQPPTERGYLGIWNFVRLLYGNSDSYTMIIKVFFHISHIACNILSMNQLFC